MLQLCLSQRQIFQPPNPSLLKEHAFWLLMPYSFGEKFLLFLTWLIFDPKYGGDMFIRNVRLPHKDAALQPRKPYSS